MATMAGVLESPRQSQSAVKVQFWIWIAAQLSVVPDGTCMLTFVPVICTRYCAVGSVSGAVSAPTLSDQLAALEMSPSLPAPVHVAVREPFCMRLIRSPTCLMTPSEYTVEE